VCELTQIDGYFCEITSSPDDDGWYVTVVGEDGKDIDQTLVYSTRWEAILAAKELIEKLAKRGDSVSESPCL